MSSPSAWASISSVKRAWLALGLALAVGPASCGFADAGDGTRTIGVWGTMRCVYPELSTQVRYQLTDGQGPCSRATITLVDADSHERIEVAAGDEAGEYEASWPGYHRRVRADIRRGRDAVRFRLEGPSPHVVTHPAPGTILGANERLRVQWRAPDGIRADRVDVHVDADEDEDKEPAVGGSVVRDGGKARLAIDSIGKGPHGLKVMRTTVLSPAGARRGARVEHTYAVETAFYRR